MKHPLWDWSPISRDPSRFVTDSRHGKVISASETGESGKCGTNPSRDSVTDFEQRKPLSNKEIHTLSLSIKESVTPARAQCVRARARGYVIP